MTEQELKRFNELMVNYTLLDVAEMIDKSLECANCPLIDRCPVNNEYDEMEETGWWKEPENSCLTVLTGYLKDGMIHDRRKENKE